MQNSENKLANLRGEFEAAISERGELPRFLHRPTTTFWRQVSAGAWQLGMSAVESAQFLEHGGDPELLRRMPQYSAELQSYLMMEAPLPHRVVANIIGEPPDMMERPTEYVSTDSKDRVGYFTREEADSILTHFGWSYPKEAEWECACRAGNCDQLFYFGQSALDMDAVEPYVILDPDSWRGNRWGFHGLFSGEWCEELYRESPASPVQDGVFAVRGGGSLFWPWQDTGEWKFCVSAMRLPHTDASQWLALRPTLRMKLA